MILWHNPRCSKSRQTLALLQERGHAPQTRLYLQDPPTEDELRNLHAMLARPALAMMRPGESVFKELQLSKATPEAALITAMATHPILIERPILLNGPRAAIGRPPEAVLEIL